jgi:hypothetical protein
MSGVLVPGGVPSPGNHHPETSQVRAITSRGSMPGKTLSWPFSPDTSENV